MRVFEFRHAIVREPGKSVVEGLRSDASASPRYEEVAREHAAYVAALRDGGLEVDILPPLEAFPDSIFVEDPAFVIPEGAIVLRPGAPTRMGEAAEIRPALERHFQTVLALSGDEHADGGDVLVTPGLVMIGLSKRTNRKGAEALKARLKTFDREARIIETTDDVLHFKTARSLLDEETVLTTPALASSGAFASYRVVVTAEGEEAAANALRVNDTILVGAQFPRTIARLSEHGFKVRPLPVTEIGKLDAGLSCMSLRW